MTIAKRQSKNDNCNTTVAKRQSQHNNCNTTVAKRQLQHDNCKTAIEKHQVLKQIFETLRGTPPGKRKKKAYQIFVDVGSPGTPPRDSNGLLQKLLRTLIGCAYHSGKMAFSTSFHNMTPERRPEKDFGVSIVYLYHYRYRGLGWAELTNGRGWAARIWAGLG